MRLRPLLRPRSVALVGATDRPYSWHVVDNLQRHGFGARTVLVNPNRKELFGHSCVPSLDAVPSVDCALLLLPRHLIAEAVDRAIAAGCRSLVVPASGYRETGQREWILAERALAARAIAADVPILGPNCIGLYSGAVHSALCIARLPAPMRKGGIALLMSSGGSMTGAIHYLQAVGGGVRYAVSVGNGAILGMAELTSAMAADPNVTGIGLLLEEVANWPVFRTGVKRAVAAGKLVVAVKVGRSTKGRQMALTHTGALGGNYAVYRDALAEIGVRVAPDLGAMIVALALRDRFGSADGRELGVMAISGGAATHVADECEAQGLPLAQLSDSTLGAIRAADASIEPDNPIDLSPAGSQNSTGFLAATAAFLGDRRIGSALYVHAQSMPGPHQQVQVELQDQVIKLAAQLHVPLVLSQLVYSHWTDEQQRLLSGIESALAINVLRDAIAGLAAWRGPESTAAPPRPGAPPEPALQWRNERELKTMLAAAGLTVPRAEWFATHQAAALNAGGMAWPVVLKGVGRRIYHKKRVGLVRMGVQDVKRLRDQARQMSDRGQPIEGFLVEEAVDEGTDLIVGIMRQSLGDVLMIGQGGGDVESGGDVRFALLPVPRSRLRELLIGYRAERHVRVVERLVDFYLANGLTSLEINPLRVSGSRAWVLDAVAVAIPELRSDG